MTGILRKQLWEHRELGEHARDTQGALDTIPRFATKKMEALYQLPMVIGSAEEPDSIELTRIVSVVSPETPVACGSLVHYVWMPQQGGSVVTGIDGLTPNNDVRYRFTFRLEFPARRQGAL